MNNLLCSHPLHLTVWIACGSPINLQRKLCLMSDWSPWFGTLRVAVDIILCGKQPDEGVLALLCPFASQGQVIFDEDYSLAQKAGLYQVRPVFGQNRESAFCAMTLADGENILYECRRLNSSTLEKAVSRAMKAQHDWLQKRIPSFVDRVLPD